MRAIYGEFFPKRDLGFTLVELMVALLIGLLVVFGATQIFITGKQSFNKVEELSIRQENFRFFVDSISLDIRSSSVVGVDVIDGGDTLLLEYDSRTDDPYCGGLSDLVSVAYSYSSGAISISYECDSGPVAAQPLVDGFDDVDFYDYVSLPDSEGKQGYVEILVSFYPVNGESDSSREFIFRVANREAVAR